MSKENINAVENYTEVTEENVDAMVEENGEIVAEETFFTKALDLCKKHGPKVLMIGGSLVAGIFIGSKIAVDNDVVADVVEDTLEIVDDVVEM